MARQIVRDQKRAVSFAKEMPKFGEVVKTKRGAIPLVGGPASHAEIFWDYSPAAIEGQVFILRINGVDYHIPKQALEHYLRAV